MSLLNVEELEAFCAVLKTGGINAAARRLRLARSVVSKRISDLEQSVVSALLHRSTSQSTLTEADEVFYERTSIRLCDLEDAVNSAQGSGDGLSGSLRCTLPVDAATTFLEAPLLAFAAAHTKLKKVVDLEDRLLDLPSS